MIQNQPLLLHSCVWKWSIRTYPPSFFFMPCHCLLDMCLMCLILISRRHREEREDMLLPKQTCTTNFMCAHRLWSERLLVSTLSARDVRIDLIWWWRLTNVWWQPLGFRRPVKRSGICNTEVIALHCKNV